MTSKMGFPKFDFSFKRQFRYTFTIPEICGIYPDDGLYCKLHEKTARPNISYKEISVEHLGQTIKFPGKVAFENTSLTLWDDYSGSADIETKNNPVWKWLNSWYNFYTGEYGDSLKGFKKTCELKLKDGYGNIIEKWIYENAWPLSVNFGDLDMGSSSVCTIDISLAYDIAYLSKN